MRDIKLQVLLDLRVDSNMMNNIVLARLAILNLHASFIIHHEFWSLYVDGKGSFESQTSFNQGTALHLLLPGVASILIGVKIAMFSPRCRWFKHNCKRCGGKYPAINQPALQFGKHSHQLQDNIFHKNQPNNQFKREAFRFGFKLLVWYIILSLDHQEFQKCIKFR